MKNLSFQLALILLFCSCGHADIDPENFVINSTPDTILMKEYENGGLFYRGVVTIPPSGRELYCPCGEYLTSDSVVFVRPNGDSIIYHNRHVANSNFEDTKARSPFVAETWNEVNTNDFEYTILPEDFQ